MEPLIKPVFSVLIPTLGRKSCLVRIVEDLIPQLLPQDEILILDQNQPALSLSLFPRYQKLKLIHSQPGLTLARNRLLSEAKGTHALFLDDDLVIENNLLAAYRQACEEFPDCVLAGRVEVDEPVDIPPPGKIDFETGKIITNFLFDTQSETLMFAGGNFCLPLKILPSRPWFNPFFKGSAQGEEIDFALRLRKKGHCIKSIPAAKVWHLKLPSGGCRSARSRDYFPLHQCFNQGLFFGRFCFLSKSLHFFIRMKGFWEFHSRTKQSFHSPAKLLLLIFFTLNGFLAGLVQRWQDYRE